MKKTLLIAVAALAAGIISVEAQVYSQNIVGYYNVTVPKNGFSLVANQLNLDNTNGISSIFGSGLVSDPNFGNNTQIFLWDSGTQQYQILYYLNAADAAGDGLGSAGFYDSGGQFYNNPLPPGGAAFLFNNANSSSNLTVTVMGTVPQQTNVYAIHQGYNLFSIAAPVSTNLVSPLIQFDGTSDPNFGFNDQILLWDAGTQQYQILYYLNAADAAGDGLGSAGFYDSGGTYYPVAPSVGTGFFIYHQVAGTEYWTNSLSF